MITTTTATITVTTKTATASRTATATTTTTTTATTTSLALLRTVHTHAQSIVDQIVSGHCPQAFQTSKTKKIANL